GYLVKAGSDRLQEARRQREARRSRLAADRRLPQAPRRRSGQQPETRSARLGAIHSFYRFAALEHPEHAHMIARVMAIATKRRERNTLSYLDRDEIAALLAAPDKRTWLGRRDHALLALYIVCLVQLV